jgi:hypothetical protein
MKSYLDINELKKISDMTAREALKKARMYGTHLSVFENGELKRETPEEYEKNLAKEMQEDAQKCSKNSKDKS